MCDILITPPGLSPNESIYVRENAAPYYIPCLNDKNK